MTTNQIAYFKAKVEEAHYERGDTETARSNRANESIKKESNAIGWGELGQKYATLEETKRHNETLEGYTEKETDANVEYLNKGTELRDAQISTEKEHAELYHRQQLNVGADTTLKNAETDLKNAQYEGQMLDNYYGDYDHITGGIGNVGKGLSGASRLIPQGGH